MLLKKSLQHLLATTAIATTAILAAFGLSKSANAQTPAFNVGNVNGNINKIADNYFYGKSTSNVAVRGDVATGVETTINIPVNSFSSANYGNANGVAIGNNAARNYSAQTPSTAAELNSPSGNFFTGFGINDNNIVAAITQNTSTGAISIGYGNINTGPTSYFAQGTTARTIVNFTNNGKIYVNNGANGSTSSVFDTNTNALTTLSFAGLGNNTLQKLNTVSDNDNYFGLTVRNNTTGVSNFGVYNKTTQTFQEFSFSVGTSAVTTNGFFVNNSGDVGFSITDGTTTNAAFGKNKGSSYDIFNLNLIDNGNFVHLAKVGGINNSDSLSISGDDGVFNKIANFDNIGTVVIPEANTLPLFALGAIGAGAVTYLKRRKAVFVSKTDKEVANQNSAPANRAQAHYTNG